jgi:hypothetical protein
MSYQHLIYWSLFVNIFNLMPFTNASPLPTSDRFHNLQLRDLLLQHISKLSNSDKRAFLQQMKSILQQNKDKRLSTDTPSSVAIGKLENVAKEFSHSLFILDSLIHHQRVRHKNQKMLALAKKMLETVG